MVGKRSSSGFSRREVSHQSEDASALKEDWRAWMRRMELMLTDPDRTRGKQSRSERTEERKKESETRKNKDASDKDGGGGGGGV